MKEEEYPLRTLEKARRDYNGKGRISLTEGWWIKKDTPPPPAPPAVLKGHHPCPCGSGKKYRDCCRGKVPTVSGNK